MICRKRFSQTTSGLDEDSQKDENRAMFTDDEVEQALLERVDEGTLVMGIREDGEFIFWFPEAP